MFYIAGAHIVAYRRVYVAICADYSAHSIPTSVADDESIPTSVADDNTRFIAWQYNDFSCLRYERV